MHHCSSTQLAWWAAQCGICAQTPSVDVTDSCALSQDSAARLSHGSRNKMPQLRPFTQGCNEHFPLLICLVVPKVSHMRVPKRMLLAEWLPGWPSIESIKKRHFYHNRGINFALWSCQVGERFLGRDLQLHHPFWLSSEQLDTLTCLKQYDEKRRGQGLQNQAPGLA